MIRKLLFFGVFAVLESGLVWAQNLKVHTIGDSTMADYMENTTRTRGWGEMLQEFFSKEVQVINYARGGRSSRSFWEEGRWDKVKENINPGDYVFIQFAHNDEKEGGKDGVDFRGTAPWTTYKSFLEMYVDETKEAGGNPIFITPIVRRYFDEKGKITSKGCHDLGTIDDDSTLNYVKVMKNVARQKKVPVVDMTALTKEFVEDLGADATIQQIYVPTDGTHTQATGAACYARIVAHDLVHQGILSEYIDSEVPMVLNPTSLDFGTIYIGNESTLCFDVTGLDLSPETGVLSLCAPEGMEFSLELHSASQRKITIPYTGGKLWNTTLYLHFKPTMAVNVNSSIVITNGNQVREIPVKAIAKRMSAKKDVTIQSADIQLKGIKKVHDSYTIESDIWPVDIDESGNRYVEFIIRNKKENALVLQSLSFLLKGNLCYRIAYARGKDFYPRTDIGESQQSNNISDKLVFPINTTINSDESLHIRLFPWNISGGKMNFQIADWQVQGFEIE